MEDKVRGQLLGHPQMARYYDGELSEEAARVVELHLATCAACRAELGALRVLSHALAVADAPDGATQAAAAWQAVQPRLGRQYPAAPWRSWLPGLLLLGLQGLLAIVGLLLAVGSVAARLSGQGGRLPDVTLPFVLLPGVPLPPLLLPDAAISSLLATGLLASAGVLYLIWLASWWSRSHVASGSVEASQFS